MGRGNLPPAMKPGIEAAAAAGVPVVLASRYGAGSVQERYGYAGGGHDLAQLGVIFAGRLNGLKARMKLMVALGLHARPRAARARFSLRRTRPRPSRAGATDAEAEWPEAP